MEYNNFHSVIPHLNTFYGIIVDETDAEDIGMSAWDKIGNKHMLTYMYTGNVEDCTLELPCNAYYIEAVTNDTIPYQTTDNKLAYNLNNKIIEQNIYKVSDSFLQTRGGFVDYEHDIVNNVLRFKKHNGPINVLYKGVMLDDDGLPFINNREKVAISDYIAYTLTFKEALISKNGNNMQFAQLLENNWKKSCGNARVPEYINQNDWDKILNAKASWGRKRFNVSYKPVL